MLQLYDKNKNKIAGLTEYKDLCIESVLETGDKTLSFLYPKRTKYHDEIIEEGYLRTKTDEFVIKEKNLQDDYTNFVCKLNVEELEGKTFDRFESVEQTITAALNLAIVGTGWTVSYNTIKKKRTVRKTNCSSWDIVQEIKKTYRLDIEFDTLNKQIKVYEHLGEDKGTYFIDSLNLKALQVQGNSYDYATRIIPVGKDGLTIESINSGKNYVENYQYSNKVKAIYWKDERYTIKENLLEDAKAKLNEISKPYRAYIALILNLAKMSDKYKDILDYKLGDTITLISKDNEVKDKQRIVKTKEYPQDHSRDTVELANATLKFEDIQKQFQDTSDTIDNVTLDDGTLDGEAFEDGGINSDKIDNFKANVIEAAEIHVIKGDIQDLNVAVLKAGQAILTKVDIAQLNALESKLQHAIIGKADINELNVAVERVGILEGKTSSIENALNKNLTAENIATGAITANSGIIAQGAIGDAEISSLSGNKLRFGTIDTGLVTVAGPNGRLKILGNKLQIFDNVNNKLFERIMLGINESNRATLTLRGIDGQTVLLTEEGLTKAGITDGFGKADDNSLSALKLDKNSIVRQVNGATETIAGTRIQVGDRTLDVELSTQKNTITEQSKELSTQKSTIQALDNAIKLKVDNQTFTQSTNTINSNINSLNSDLIGKINTNLNTAKSYADSKKQEAITNASTDATNKANNALKNAKDFTTAQITTTNSNLSKATSEINILKGQISTKVSQSDIDKTVNNIQIGGRNYIVLKNISSHTPYNSISNENGVIKLVRNNNTNNFITLSIIGFTPENKEYTLSGICKLNDKPIPKDFFRLNKANTYNSGSSNVIVRDDGSFQITETWTGSTRWIMHTSTATTSGDVITFEKLKFEEGEFATTYTEAPEDLNDFIINNIKVVTDKINDVSTKLTQTKDSLQASVNSLNSTTQTITTNLTNTTNTLNNKINTAKTDAINSANAYTNTTKQQVINSANSHADNIATSKSNEALNNAKTYTNAQITTVNTRVNNAESSINILKNQISTKVSQNDIDKTVNNIQIGGRNFALGTSQSKSCQNSGWIIYELSKDVIRKGEITISYTANSQYRLGGGLGFGNSSGYDGNYLMYPFFEEGDKYYSYTISIDLTNQTHICIWVNATTTIKNLKLEKGNKATDWTASPEDTNQLIVDNITTVTEKINTVESTFRQKTNNINASVNSIQSILTTKADGSTVSSMQSQLSSLNIGLNGIKLEVAKKTDKGSIISVINQSAENISINANKINLNGATTFARSTGLKAIQIKDSIISFYDWEGSGRDEAVGMIYSTRTSGDARKPGIAIGAKANATFDIIYQKNNQNFPFITFDKDNITGTGFPITFYDEISLYDSVLWLGTTRRNSMYESSEGNFTIRTAHGLKIADKDNGTLTADLDANYTGFGKWDHKYFYAVFKPDEFNLSNGKGRSYFWTESGNSNIFTGSGINMKIQGDLTVTGRKNRIVKDTIYGDLALNAVESTECWFTDMLIEQSRTDANGDCIIWFDNKFLQTVNTRYKYKVDVTPLGEFASNGKLTYVRVVEKTEKYFKVRGTPNTLFDWTITAKQKGYERDRLEKAS